MVSLKYNSLNYSKYLNNCDLNYKYFLKSINDTPSIEKIVFELPTNMLPNMETAEDDYRTKTLLKCFLAFYYINLKMPYINCNNFKTPSFVNATNNSYHYAYLISYNNLMEKYKLLSLLLNETDSYNTSINTLTKLTKNITTNKQEPNFLNLRLEVEALKVVEFKEILSNIFNRVELQKLKFKVNIVFKNINNKVLSINEVKNFFYIWNI